MNQRDFSELKRRLNPDKKNPSIVRGCYLRATGEMITSFSSHVETMTTEENEKYMAIFRKALSGTQGRNLLPVGFSTEQLGSEEYLLLNRMRDSALRDDASMDAFYGRVIRWIQSMQTELSVDELQKAPNWLVLTLNDGMDVPFRDHNEETDPDRSAGSFSYILCAICPVKQSASALTWSDADSSFHSRESDWTVSAPEMGLLFPAFEEGGANVNEAVFYTKDASDPHESFLSSLLGIEAFMPAKAQQETLGSVLQESLGEECSMEVIQAVHESVGDLIKAQKEDKHADPLTLNAKDVSRIMQECGVSAEKAESFEEQYSATFGERAELPAVNVLSPNEYKVTTPSVQIKVAPDHTELVQTRVIDGQCYVMVLVDGDVEVNGVRVQFS